MGQFRIRPDFVEQDRFISFNGLGNGPFLTVQYNPHICRCQAARRANFKGFVLGK